MRVTTAFNRILNLDGATVSSVSFEEAGLVLGIHRRSRKLHCPCGWTTRACYDTSVRRWRHLDMGATKTYLEAEIKRLFCKNCQAVVTEVVPWARPGGRFSKDYEDVVVWLCQKTNKTTVSTLMRCSWRSVDAIVERVVFEHLDTTRLDNLYRIGVDEIAYKKGHNYLTIVADHDTGNVVWIADGKSREALEGLFDELGEERCRQIQAISMDFTPIYRGAAQDRISQAAICLDPFHAVQFVNRALDAVFKQSRYGVDQPIDGRDWQRARIALRVGYERLSNKQSEVLSLITKGRRHLARAYELKEDFRDLYRIVDPKDARAYLKSWITSALRSKIPAFKKLGRTFKNHFEGIIAAIELGLANTRLEGINGHVRLIQRESHGLTNPDSLAAMIYLRRGGITVKLPTQM